MLLPPRLFAAILFAAQAAHAECRMTAISHLPFTELGHHLLVPVTLDGKPAQMIFDTGAATTILTLAAANRLGLRHMQGEETANPYNTGLIATIGGIGGSRNAMAVTARSVDIGGLTARDYNFLAADFLKPPADGLLSIDLISKYDVDLDFPENRIVLYYPTGDCSAPAAFLSSPLYSVPLLPFGRDRRPRIKITINGKQVTALIDTGAPRSAIYRHAAERLGLFMQNLANDPHLTANGVGPNTVTAVDHVFGSIAVGDLIFDNMKVDILDDHAGEDNVEMLLGGNFQRAVHLWISYSSGTLIMQFPPRPSKRTE